MRFVFLQPELRSATTSHFYHYIQAIEESLSKKGYNSITIASEVFETQNNNPSIPAFRNRTNRYSHPIAVLWRILSRNITSYFDFKKIMNQLLKQDPQTVFFVDTVQNERVVALALAFRGIAGRYPESKLGVVFRFTYRSNSFILTRIQQQLHNIYSQIQQGLILQERSFMFTDSVLLQSMYGQHISAPVQVMPIPLRSVLYEKMYVKRILTAKVNCIGFIGGKVGYKGLDKFIHFMCGMIEHEVWFSVHGVRDLKDFFDFAKSVLQPSELELLKQYAGKIHTFSHLNEKEYLALFDQMDVILLPYTSLQFADGTSNIFAESAAAGVIPLVPSQTWMESELIKAGMPELAVDFNNPAQVLSTVMGLIENSTDVKEKMNRFSASWRKFHSSHVFTDLLIKSMHIYF